MDIGHGLFVEVPRECGTSVRDQDTLPGYEYESRTLSRVPGRVRLSGGPVDLSVFGLRDWTLCRDTGVGVTQSGVQPVAVHTYVR